jgi:hypothetical protein
MARAPAAQKIADEIIGQLEALDAANLGRIIEAATSLRSQKQAAERDAFIARVREEAAAIGLVPEQFRPGPTSPQEGCGWRHEKAGEGHSSRQIPARRQFLERQGKNARMVTPARDVRPQPG